MTLLLAMSAALVPTASISQTLRADSARDWLMMVSTNSTDPAKEAEFNSWYDDIDIPDVLEVPGYVRARRGRSEEALPGKGRYVALYDIESANMDRTIIDMLMATRKMESRKRSTPLLEVVERLYYRRFSRPIEVGPRPAADGSKTYLYLERYDDEHLRDRLRVPALVRSTTYELYRVLMVDPIAVPRFLTVYELEAGSAASALEQIKGATVNSMLYLQIKDVRRAAL